MRFVLVSLLVMLLPTAAHASYWLRCEVLADVSKADRPKYYHVSVLRAEVVEGHMEKGSPCMPKHVGNTLTVMIPDQYVPLGERKKLRFEYYNGRGEQGEAINNESWSAPHPLKKYMFTQ